MRFEQILSPISIHFTNTLVSAERRLQPNDMVLSLLFEQRRDNARLVAVRLPIDFGDTDDDEEDSDDIPDEEVCIVFYSTALFSLTNSTLGEKK